MKHWSKRPAKRQGAETVKYADDTVLCKNQTNRLIHRTMVPVYANV